MSGRALHAWPALLASLVLVAAPACAAQTPPAAPAPATGTTAAPTSPAGSTAAAAPAPTPPSAEVSRPLYSATPVCDIELKDPKRLKVVAMSVVAPEMPLRADMPMPKEFPLVVFSHGLGGSQEAFPSLATYLAERGFIVIRPTHADSARYMKRPGDLLKDPKSFAKALNLRDRVADLVFILNSLDNIEKTAKALQGADGVIRVDRAHIAAAGHSAGALTTALAVGTEARALDKTAASYMEGLKSIADPRFKCGVVISGPGLNNKMLTEDSWKKIAVPTITFAGSLDTTPASDETPQSRQDGFKHSRGVAGGGPPAWLVFIDGATHSSYGGGAKALPLDAPAEGATDPKLVSAVTNEVVYEFLAAELLGDAAAKAWLANPDHVKSISQGKATLQSK
jgi:predicted dienelactone hydrolase